MSIVGYGDATIYGIGQMVRIIAPSTLIQLNDASFGISWSTNLTASTNAYTSPAISRETGQYQFIWTGNSENKLYYSTSYGVSGSWSLIANNPLPAPSYYASVAVSASGSYQLISASSTYISSNYGNSWSMVLANELVWTRISDSANYMIGTTWDGKCYVSSNYGTNWTMRATVGTVNGPPSIGISGNGKYMLAASFGYDGVKLSTNYGVNWTTVLPNGEWSGPTLSYTGQYAIIGSNDSVWKSSNYGSNWFSVKPIATPTYPRWRYTEVSYTGKYMLAGGYDGGSPGLYASTNYGEAGSWYICPGTSALKIYRIAMSNDGRYLSCGQIGSGNKNYISVTPLL